MQAWEFRVCCSHQLSVVSLECTGTWNMSLHHTSLPILLRLGALQMEFRAKSCFKKPALGSKRTARTFEHCRLYSHRPPPPGLLHEARQFRHKKNTPRRNPLHDLVGNRIVPELLRQELPAFEATCPLSHDRQNPAKLRAYSAPSQRPGDDDLGFGLQLP